MGRAQRALYDAFTQTYRYLGLTVLSTLGAVVLSIPIALLAVVVLRDLHATGLLPIVLVALIVVFPAPTNSGVQFVAHETAHRNPVFWRDQIDGLREHGWMALRCWLVSSIVGILLAANAVFYLQHRIPLSGIIAAGWTIILVWWLLIHLYVFPLIMEQEEKRLLLVYRNALLIAIARPVFTVGVGFVWLAAVYALSFTSLIAIFGLMLCAQIQQNATTLIVPTFEERSPDK